LCALCPADRSWQILVLALVVVCWKGLFEPEGKGEEEREGECAGADTEWIADAEGSKWASPVYG